MSMDGLEISKILNNWASALKEDDGKKNRLPLCDLVKKYSHEVKTGKCDATPSHSVRPWSSEDFTSRLLTFQQSSAWFAKPSIVSALQCARHGWCNRGSDQLYCHTCSATLTHQKVDDNGQCLREALSSGHSSHCGWTDNFCSEEFLSFQETSTESLVVNLLQRVRLTLLALFEWARIICETEGEGATAQGTPSKVTSSSRLKVEVGSSVSSSSPQLSKWLLDGILHGDGGAVLEMVLSDICSSSSRAHVTAAVERISSMLRSSRDSSSSTLSSDSSRSPGLVLAGLPTEVIEGGAGNDESVSTILRALLPPGTGSKEDHLIRISVLLAVCGWNPVASVDPISEETAATSLTATSSADMRAAGRITLDSLRCSMCGRSYPFKYLLSSPVDPLFQHRTFCLWAHSSSDDALTGPEVVPPGWLQCASAVLSIDIYGTPPAERRRSADNRVSLASVHAGSDREGGDAEQTYKKIKLVLDQAAFTRVNQTGRLSI